MKIKKNKIGVLENAVGEAKIRFEKHNITIKEISENTKVDEALLMVFLDDTNKVMDSLSRLFEFAKVKFTTERRYIFKVYRTILQGNRAKIIRVIEPKCYIYYDISKGTFHNFKWTRKSYYHSVTKERTQEIINEMAEFAKQK